LHGVSGDGIMRLSSPLDVGFGPATLPTCGVRSVPIESAAGAQLFKRTDA
jgi:hypothetical protein